MNTVSDPPQADPLDRTLGLSVGLLVAVLTLFEFTHLDLVVQDQLYNFTTGQWLVNRNGPFGRLVFYNAPKFAVIAIGTILLGLWLGPTRWRQRVQFRRKDILVAVLTIITVPALANYGKSVTNTFCPSQIHRYGGDVPYVASLASYPQGSRPHNRGRCFPAGHASGGFALLALVWLRCSRRWRKRAIAIGVAVGWWMGGYQMLKGAHYLSHTLVTMLLAWVILLLWRRIIKPWNATEAC